MNQHDSSRRLLLERLENRSLLAGGILDSTFASDNEPQPFKDLDRRTSRSGIETRPTPRHDHHDGRPKHPDRIQRDARPSHDNRFRNQPPGEQTAPSNPPPFIADRLVSLTPSVTVSNERPGSQPTTPLPQPATPSPARLINVDVAMASLASTQAETSVIAAGSQPEEAEQGIAPIENASSEGGRDAVIARDTSKQTLQLDSSAAVNYFVPTDADDGTIDLSPQQRFKPSETPNDAEPWHLDRRTLPLLNDVIEAAPQQDLNIADQVANDWLNGPGGMIALDQVTLPSGDLTIPLQHIDVQLESGLGLHRSLGLVANGMAPAISGPVLDAIMASLEQVATSDAQPVAQRALPAARTLAYPAIAVVATTLVISSRRKQFKNQSRSNLQSTSAKST